MTNVASTSSVPASVLERRPLRMRELRLVDRAARALAARSVSPNAVSFFGLCCGLAAGGVLAATGLVLDPLDPLGVRALWLLAAVLIVPTRLVVPWAPDEAHAEMLGTTLRRRHRPTMMVGPRAAF